MITLYWCLSALLTKYSLLIFSVSAAKPLYTCLHSYRCILSIVSFFPVRELCKIEGRLNFRNLSKKNSFWMRWLNSLTSIPANASYAFNKMLRTMNINRSADALGNWQSCFHIILTQTLLFRDLVYPRLIYRNIWKCSRRLYIECSLQSRDKIVLHLITSAYLWMPNP